MPRARTAAAICRAALAALALGVSVAAADSQSSAMNPYGVALPRRSRAVDGRHVSALGYRATIDHYAKLWKKDGIPVVATGPYRVGGVDVTRFVRANRAGEWLAVHVWRAAGVTWISVVPRPAAPQPRPGLDGGGTTE